MFFQLIGDPTSANFHISTVCMDQTEIVLVVRKCYLNLGTTASMKCHHHMW